MPICVPARTAEAISAAYCSIIAVSKPVPFAPPKLSPLSFSSTLLYCIIVEITIKIIKQK